MIQSLPTQPSGQIRLAIIQDLIDHGIAQSHTLCPIALAIRQLWPQAKVAVGRNLIHINQDTHSAGYSHTLTVSIRLGRWIDTYDVRRHKATPITILLDFKHNIACLTHQPPTIQPIAFPGANLHD